MTAILYLLPGVMAPFTSEALAADFGTNQISVWIKIAYTLFILVLIPIYWRQWGVANFLWFSDVALLGSVVALWLESPLLASMMAIGVLLPELYWNVEMLTRLLTGLRLAGLPAR